MIELKNVSFAYVSEDVLRNVNLAFGPGVTAIIGPNGSGKTTLLKLAAAIYRPRVGEILIDGVNPWSASETVKLLARRNVVYVHEKPIMLRGSVADNVAYGLRVRNVPAEEVAARTEEVLELLGIKHLAHEKAQTLSAGQQQKVALARALAVRPKNLLLDEPTANLDKNGWETFIELIKELAREGVCIAIATHDRLLAMRLADRIALVENKIVTFVESPEHTG
ncbi:MAG: energy-coupling factor ABC transporter ATP-binding protein [Thaumarchaeota archaeon]|jgi:ABC-type multidrug transport system ATPase subunit|nr:energy-coupling factor ABC transporter ATP-binding protein [Candidatus Terraquivivens yellowstonensis]